MHLMTVTLQKYYFSETVKKEVMKASAFFICHGLYNNSEYNKYSHWKYWMLLWGHLQHWVSSVAPVPVVSLPVGQSLHWAVSPVPSR